MDKTTEEIMAHIEKAKRILIITGAGISADAGLPVYRGADGLYNDGGFENLLTPETLENSPGTIWSFLGRLDSARRDASPSAAHRVIAEAQLTHPGWISLFTQNIDGLHQEAGSTGVVELHGNMYRIRCDQCGWRTSIRSYDELDQFRICPKCNYLSRPDVVLFNEMLPFDANQRLIQATSKGFDIGIAVGTTGSFYYIQRPFEAIRDSGGVVIEINPCETAMTHLATHKLRTTASEGLGYIFKQEGGRNAA